MKAIRTIKAAFSGAVDRIDYVYGHGRKELIAQRAEVNPEVISARTLEADPSQFADVEVIFSTWGFPRYSPEQLDKLPSLRAVFYAAGAVGSFAPALLERGILLTSAWRLNGVPVAEFTLAQILLSGKRYWASIEANKSTALTQDETGNFVVRPARGAGNYGETVALLGAGAIGRYLIELLRPFGLHVIVFDPFLHTEDAQRMGVEKVSLADAFSRGYVVSNHLADKPETAGLITGALLATLRPGATFINSGRGRTVNHPEMEALLETRSDITALLDVTDPEPLPESSRLRALPNVHISSHIAGSIGNEVQRMADSVIAEFDRYSRGEPLQDAVTLEMLATMA